MFLVDVSAAGAACNEVVAGHTEQCRTAAGLQRQGLCLVLQQDHAFSGGFASRQLVGFLVRLIAVGVLAEGWQLQGYLQDVLHIAVNDAFGEPSLTYGGDDFLYLFLRTGHQ